MDYICVQDLHHWSFNLIWLFFFLVEKFDNFYAHLFIWQYKQNKISHFHNNFFLSCSGLNVILFYSILTTTATKNFSVSYDHIFGLWKFRMFINFSFFILQGLISITISEIEPTLQPPPCPTQMNCKEASALQLWVLYISMLLTYLGSSAIRPCVVIFVLEWLELSKLVAWH